MMTDGEGDDNSLEGWNFDTVDKFGHTRSKLPIRFSFASGGGWEFQSAAAPARVMGPREVAGTLHSENPWELGGGKGTNRQISLRGFEECEWLPKNVKRIGIGGR